MGKGKISAHKECSKEFTKAFRAILYNPHLTWGAKALALAIVDSPGKEKIKYSVIIRKLGIRSGQCYRWLKQLRKENRESRSLDVKTTLTNIL